MFHSTKLSPLCGCWKTLFSPNVTNAKKTPIILWIERYGSGLLKIIAICEDCGIVKPVFKEIKEGFQVILYKKTNPTDREIENVTTNVIEKRSKRILCLISQDPHITTEEMSEVLGVTNRTVLRDIERLKNKGILIYEGPQKGGYWKVINGEDN